MPDIPTHSTGGEWIRAWPVSGNMKELLAKAKVDGEQNLIEKWLQIGERNPWISNAYDPPFSKESFCRCESLEALYSELSKGNWCLGQAFYFENIAFINQVDGGDEWLVIREALPFESISVRFLSLNDFREFCSRIKKATDTMLKKLEY